MLHFLALSGAVFCFTAIVLVVWTRGLVAAFVLSTMHVHSRDIVAYVALFVGIFAMLLAFSPRAHAQAMSPNAWYGRLIEEHFPNATQAQVMALQAFVQEYIANQLASGTLPNGSDANLLNLAAKSIANSQGCVNTQATGCVVNFNW